MLKYDHHQGFVGGFVVVAVSAVGGFVGGCVVAAVGTTTGEVGVGPGEGIYYFFLSIQN